MLERLCYACSLLGLQGDRLHKVNMIVLLGRWSLKGHLSVSPWRTAAGRDVSLSHCDSFTQKMMLYMPFIINTGKGSAQHVLC